MSAVVFIESNEKKVLDIDWSRTTPLIGEEVVIEGHRYRVERVVHDEMKIMLGGKEGPLSVGWCLVSPSPYEPFVEDFHKEAIQQHCTEKHLELLLKVSPHLYN